MNFKSYQNRFAGFLALLVVAGVIYPADVTAGKPGMTGGTSYKVIKLDDVSGNVEGFAYDVNGSRLVVGVARNFATKEEFACCWTITETKRSLLSTLQYLSGGDRAWGCNDLGEIVGDGDSQALYWPNYDESPIMLPGDVAGVPTGANAICNDRVICGFSLVIEADGIKATALAWRVTDTGIWGPLVLSHLSTDPSGFDYSVANDVSDQDSDGYVVIVGQSNGDAVSWKVQLTDDGRLASDTATILAENGEAMATSPQGVICGNAELDASTNGGEAAIWAEGSPILLDLGKSSYPAFPYDMNGTGVIVGTTHLYSEAVVWPSPNQAMVSLNTFVKNSDFTSLNQARAVNPSGEIVGYGHNDAGFNMGFLALPK